TPTYTLSLHDALPIFKPTPQDLSKPIPKELDYARKEIAKAAAKAQAAQAEGKEGRGAKAKGPTGTRGNPKSKPGKEHQNMAKRRSEEHTSELQSPYDL